MGDRNNMEDFADGFFRKLGMLDVDADIGIKYCGEVDFYKEILRISVESYMEKSADLSKLYCEEEYERYTILVHSIKSGAANIGAMILRDMARDLEQAGKNNDYAFIRSNHNSFMLYYKKLMEGVAEIIQYSPQPQVLSNDEATKEISAQEWKECLSEMNYNLTELEIDMALELVDKMLCFKLPSGKANDIVLEIRTQLQHFDVEGAKNNLSLLVKEQYVL